MDRPPSLSDYASSDPDELFSEAVLKRLGRAQSCRSNGPGCSSEPGEGLRARPLQRGDYDKGYLSLLSQLTHVGEYSREVYEAQFDAMRAAPGCHYVLVVEDTAQGRVVCNGSLIVERKFIHKCALRGRIEDIVVDQGYRKLRLGSFVVELLTALSRELGCYKVTLDCKPEVAGFYERCGYVNEGQLYLSKRFFH